MIVVHLHALTTVVVRRTDARSLVGVVPRTEVSELIPRGLFDLSIFRISSVLKGDALVLLSGLSVGVAHGYTRSGSVLGYPGVREHVLLGLLV